MSRRRIKTQTGTPPGAPEISTEALNKLKSLLVTDALDTAFILMLGIPVMVLHDKYGQLIKKEVDGKGRLERFTDLILDLYDSYIKGYLTLDDIHKVLKEEGGVEIIKQWDKKRLEEK